MSVLLVGLVVGVPLRGLRPAIAPDRWRRVGVRVVNECWVVLPGMAETTEEFSRVVALLPPSYDVRLVDPWQTPVTSAPEQLREATGVGPRTPVRLVGHSIGGLAALRWALTRPGEVDRLILVDTSLTSETGWTWFYPGTPGDRMVRKLLTSLGRIGLPQLLGPVTRRLFLRIGSSANRNLLPKPTVKTRYGAAGSWLLFWDELAASWRLAREVAALLDRADLLKQDGLLPRTVLLVATGGSARFTARQRLAAHRELAEHLDAEVKVLADSAHLVHLDRPDAIAAAITEASDLAGEGS